MKTARLVEGNPKSLVRVIEYEDLQCGDCAAYRKMMDEQLLPRFGSSVAFEHRDFPLAKHELARPAAVVARYFAAQEPAIAVEFRRMMLVNRADIALENFEQRVSEFAVRHGIEQAAVVSALGDPDIQALVEHDFQEGTALGVSKTPTVFVNGEPFIERFAFDDIARAIESAVMAAKQ